MQGSRKLTRKALQALGIALGLTVLWALWTLSIAAAQTPPEPTPTPVVAAVPAASNWALILLGGALAIALGWVLWRRRQVHQGS